MFVVNKGRMSVPAPVCIFSVLCSFASASGAALSDPDETVNPWRGTGIEFGFIDEKISTANCSKSDREFLSCIGAGVQPMVDAALVTAVVRDGPAAKAGLRVHDFILEIDGRSVTGLSGDSLVERLRGRNGTPVGLKVKRQDEVTERSVRRGADTVKNVVSDAFVDRGWRLAFLRIDSFLRPDTCREFRRELTKRLKPNLNGLPLERQVWKPPNTAGVNELDECAKQTGLAEHRMRPDAEMSRAMDYPLAVAQDALACSLTRPR